MTAKEKRQGMENVFKLMENATGFVEKSLLEYDLEIAGYYASKFEYSMNLSNVETEIKVCCIATDSYLYSIWVAITIDSPDNLEEVFLSMIDSITIDESAQSSSDPSTYDPGTANSEWKEFLGDKDISKVSIIGAGMRNHSGVALKMFETLAKENINIMMISTSEVKISCVIEEKYTELAVRVLHESFGLETSDVREG